MKSSIYSDQYQAEWANEPDPESLRRAYDLLSSDRELAISQLKELAARGSVMSMIYIGRTIRNQLKTGNNYEEMLKWYQQAAESGIRYAVYSYARALFLADRSKDGLILLESDALKNYAPALNRLVGLFRK